MEKSLSFWFACCFSVGNANFSLSTSLFFVLEILAEQCLGKIGLRGGILSQIQIAVQPLILLFSPNSVCKVT